MQKKISESGITGILPAAAAVFLISSAVIALELVLMRCLSVATFHHFAYLVISTSLIGFGASGTLLTFIGHRLERRFATWCTALTSALAVAVPLSFHTIQALPLDVRYVLYSWEQAGFLMLYHVALSLPFFIGGIVIGLSLTHLKEKVHLVYAANLFGSGAGGLLILPIMFLMPEVKLIYVVSLLALLAAVLWRFHDLKQTDSALWPVLWPLLAGTAIVCMPVVQRLNLRIDTYKGLATARRWEKQSDAKHIATRHGPRARIDIYETTTSPFTLFAGWTAPAPERDTPQLRLYRDASPWGVSLKIRKASQATLLDHTPMSVAHRLIEKPRVLLLGETDGTNVWLAKRWDASRITVVQRNPQLVEMWYGSLAEPMGHVFQQQNVEVITRDPRLFLEQTDRTYDIIQLAGAEGMTAGVAGLLSVHEDFLLTRESFQLCLKHLSPEGVISVTRQKQSPPRGNIKLLNTFVSALETGGCSHPAQHIVQLRNYLAVCTLVSRKPFGSNRYARLKQTAAELQLDTPWLPIDGGDSAQQYARVPGPPGKSYSYLHHAARTIFSADRAPFLSDYIYNVEVPTDDRPYFHNFFRWESISKFRRVYGRNWFRRSEPGYVAVVAVLIEVIVVGAILIVLPLLISRQIKFPSGFRIPTLLYFLILGITFMVLEMTLIIRFTHFLGDPILSAGLVLSIFLLFTGLGSWLSGRSPLAPPHTVMSASAAIIFMSIGLVLTLGPFFAFAAGWPVLARLTTAIVLIAPLATLMGCFFPSGIACLRARRPEYIPWAWAVNGFASVAGPPIGVLLATGTGLANVMLLGAVLYGCAGLLIMWLAENY